MQCSNNLKQIALASHNFYDVHDRYPCQNYDPLWQLFNGSFSSTGVAHYEGRYPCRIRHPGLIPLLFPFMEQGVIFDLIKQEGLDRAKGQNGTGNHDSIANMALSRVKINAFLCPSDSATGDWTGAYTMWTNYRVNLGDLPGPILTENASYASLVPWLMGSVPRGWAETGWWSSKSISYVTDGLSNSILFSEGLITPNSAQGKTTNGGFRSGSVFVNGTIRNGSVLTYNAGGAHADPLTTGIVAPQTLLNLKGNPAAAITPFPGINGHTASNGALGLGRCAMGMPVMDASFFTFLPPNGPSIYQDATRVCPTASSYHTSGVNAALMDASVHFIADQISTKNFDLEAMGADPLITMGNDPADKGTYADAASVIPEKCRALTTIANRINAGDEFSYGIWADLGCINDGNAVAVP
jgi:hypothetical protein